MDIKQKIVVHTTKFRCDMDRTKRQITKIAREVQNYVRISMKIQGVGSGECDILHLVRKNPGISPAAVSQTLMMDKAAIAKRAANLEAKGFLRREADKHDRRKQHLFATEKCEEIKNSRTELEAGFYSWLLEDIPEEQSVQFIAVLEKLYEKAKAESRAGFPHLIQD